MDKSIEQRLKAIEARLDKLEGNAPRQQHILETPIKSTVTPSSVSTGQVLGIIALVCFVFASALIVKLAIDSGWLTQIRQVALSYLLGATLIGSGFWLLDKDRAYAAILPATGIIIFYLTTFAAYRYYGLFPFTETMIITSAISVICILFSLKINHDIYPVLAAIGSYIAPIIIQFDHTNILFSPFYFICCSIAFATISIWLSSRILAVIAAYMAILTSAFVGYDSHLYQMVAYTLPLLFVIFSVASLVYSSIHRRVLTNYEAWCFFPVLIIFYATEFDFLRHCYPTTWAAWISLSFAAFMFLLLVTSRALHPQQTLPSQAMLTTFITVILFHSGYIELLPAESAPWLLLFAALSYVRFGAQIKTNMSFNNYAAPVAALLLILVNEYRLALIGLFNYNNFQAIGASLLISASIWIVLVSKHLLKKGDPSLKEIIFLALHILALALFLNVFRYNNSLAVSATWLLYAVIILTVGYEYRDNIVVRSAILIFCVSALKALLYDAMNAPTAVRILCLLLTGVVLYAAGIAMRRFSAFLLTEK